MLSLYSALLGAPIPDPRRTGPNTGIVVPDPDPTPIPGLSGVADMFIGWGKWTLIIAGVLGIFICGGMMILGRRNRSSTAVDGATGIPWVFGGLTLASIGATVVGAVLR